MGKDTLEKPVWGKDLGRGENIGIDRWSYAPEGTTGTNSDDD